MFSMTYPWRILLLGLVLLLLPGCGGCGISGRGKNSDFDRPKATALR